MNTGGYDRDHEHEMEAESNFSISGKTTPSGATYLPQVLDAQEEIRISYEWGERGVTSEELPRYEAEEFIAEATGRGSRAQPSEKRFEGNYWTDAPDSAMCDLKSTSLPNPVDIRVDGEIEATVQYDDGTLAMFIEFDTEYVHEGRDEEISEGNFRITYAEPFKQDAESEFERTRAALDQLDKLGSLLE